MPIPVEGKIGERWRAWGAADGPFGPPLRPEEEVPGRNGRRQQFERGEIGWSPDQDMTVSVFRLRNEACFQWSRSQFAYDHFRCNVTYDGNGQGWDRLPVRSADPNRRTVSIVTSLQGFGEYAFTVKGVTDDDESPQGWTIPMRLQLGPSAAPLDPDWPKVSDVIAERWQELGAWDGPLGKPVKAEDFNPDGGVRNQEFEYGRIFTAPAFGPRMVVAAHQRGRSIEVNWGGADTFFNAFRVDVSHNGTKFLQKLVWVPFPNIEWARSGISSGQFRLENTRGDGFYTFRIHPTITPVNNPGLAPSPEPGVTVDPLDAFGGGLSDSDFLSGSTPEVGIWFERGPADALLDPLAIDGTPAHAFASHATRASAIARHYARTRPLGLLRLSPGRATENDTIQLIAHLQAVSEDPTFRVQGEMPSRILAHAVLGVLSRGGGEMGTSYDEIFAGHRFHRLGDYDMTLKGLMVIAYRYRDLLTQEELDFILKDLVPGHLNGRHDPAIESYAIVTENAPETENHMLMINSTRYLVNQLLHDQTGDQKFDNVENGLADWLLGYLHTIAKHDFLEFNSRPYQRMSLHVLFNLHEFARDEPVWTAAEILLDYTMVKFAVSSNRQRRICPFRRLKENTNSPDKLNDLLREGHGGDPVTGFFYMYAGPTDRDGKPTRWFPDDLTFNAVISGLADYRPPPAAYILAMTRYGPVPHVFDHGRRPQMHEADEDADGGVEIYYHSPSFLLTAGGMWLNSGYGRDEFLGYKQVAIAQATTLLFTRALDVRAKPDDVDIRPDLDAKFADLIRFDRWPSQRIDDGEVESLERDAVNTAVHLGFACGANLEIPDKWLSLAGASWEGRWLFLDLNRQPDDTTPEQLRPYGPLGLYVAAYRTPIDPTQAEQLDVLYDAVPPKTLGLLYAIEADTIDPVTGVSMTFAKFKEQVRERNNTFPDPLRWAGLYAFHTVDNHRFDFWLRPDSHKYSPRIFKVDGQEVHPEGTSRPLVDGPYLKSPGGHGGLIEIRHPGCDTPLVLDFRNPENPMRLDNMSACPQPWLDRAQALIEVAGELWGQSRKLQTDGKIAEAVVAAQTAVDVQRGFTPPPSMEAAYQLRFGRVLQNLAYVLIAAQRFDEAEVVAKEAVEVLLAAAASGADLYECASEIMALSGYLATAAKTASAVVAAQKAVDLLRGITPSIAVKAVHWWWFGKAWQGLAVNLILDGRVDEAARPANEAVGAYRAAAASGADRAKIREELVDLSGKLADAGRNAEAVATAQAAEEILHGG